MRPAGEPRQRVNLRIPSVSPTATYVLIAINVIVFLIRAFSAQIDEQLYLWGANHAPDIFQHGEYYRLLTSMFLHAGIFNEVGKYALQYSFHIFSNMYVLYAVGVSMERLFGNALLDYLFAGRIGWFGGECFVWWRECVFGRSVRRSIRAAARNSPVAHQS